MKVYFPGTTAQESPKFVWRLEPGENEVPDEVAKGMLAVGLVYKDKATADSAAERAKKAAEKKPAERPAATERAPEPTPERTSGGGRG